MLHASTETTLSVGRIIAIGKNDKQLVCGKALSRGHARLNITFKIVPVISPRRTTRRSCHLASSFTWKTERIASPEVGHATYNTIRLFGVEACVFR
jgi:hypothetical protein